MKKETDFGKEIAIYDPAKPIAIQNDGDRERTYSLLVEVKQKRKTIVDFFKDSKEKAHATWKAICGNEKTFTDKLDLYDKTARAAIKVFDDNKEALRVAEENRLKAIAEKNAARATAALEKRAEKTLDPEKKAALLDRAANIVPDFISLPSAATGGRKVWKWRLINKMEVPLEYMIPDEKLLNSLAGQGRVVPGIEFYQDTALVVRA